MDLLAATTAWRWRNQKLETGLDLAVKWRPGRRSRASAVRQQKTGAQMPSHTLPRGPEFRSRRTAARARRRGKWRHQIPLYLVFLTGLQVAGWPSAEGSAGRQVLNVIGAAIGSALFTMVFVLVLMPVYLRAETIRQKQAAPRPRWQYLVIAAAWMSIAGGLIAGSLMIGRFHVGPGWLARACGGSGVWFAAFGMGVLGRAVCWGQVRNLFWWHQPLWMPH